MSAKFEEALAIDNKRVFAREDRERVAKTVCDLASSQLFTFNVIKSRIKSVEEAIQLELLSSGKDHMLIANGSRPVIEGLLPGLLKGSSDIIELHSSDRLHGWGVKMITAGEWAGAYVVGTTQTARGSVQCSPAAVLWSCYDGPFYMGAISPLVEFWREQLSQFKCKPNDAKREFGINFLGTIDEI